VLVLPNVWDVASARIVEEAGYHAVATTSAGVAASLDILTGRKFRHRKCSLPLRASPAP
jgi:2-methylisocitrate lyase-like PEP mutase family enzyme